MREKDQIKCNRYRKKTSHHSATEVAAGVFSCIECICTIKNDALARQFPAANWLLVGFSLGH